MDWIIGILERLRLSTGPDPLFAIMSRERAKLSYRWQAAYIERWATSRGGLIRVEETGEPLRVPCCPICAAQIVDKDAIQVVAEHGYLLVRGADRTITGIVTATDLSNQLMQLAGPFLFIGEIEGYLRQLIYKKFTIEQLRGEAPSFDSGRTINGSADLTLGGYCRLLVKEDN